jgi:hypothetical protein
MAELNVAAGANRHKGIVRSKKLSTRVDLTPMVDLGFLLITFFIFTTTMTEPTALKLLLPADTKIDMPIRESTALTVIPVANDKVVYYHGHLQDAERSGQHGVTNFSVAGGIGAVIRLKQHELGASGRFKRSDMMLIIRPVTDASYKNVVDALDEVLINQVDHYSFVDITDEELQFLARHGYGG